MATCTAPATVKNCSLGTGGASCISTHLCTEVALKTRLIDHQKIFLMVDPRALTVIGRSDMASVFAVILADFTARAPHTMCLKGLCSAFPLCVCRWQLRKDVFASAYSPHS